MKNKSQVIEGTRIFWRRPKNVLTISSYGLKQFLELYGFSQFATSSDRKSGKQIIHNDTGIIKAHNAISVKRWVMTWLEGLSEEVWKEGIFQGQDKFDVLETWQNFSAAQLTTKVLNDLTIFSEEGFNDTEKLNLFSDEASTCHIRFQNAVVRITAEEIKLLSYDEVQTEGAVFESAIINRNISLVDKDRINKGLFSKFAQRAMYRRKAQKPEIIGDWIDEFEINDATKEHYKGLRTAYGYLIHSYNTSDTRKAVYFIDAESDMKEAQGGNGKSVVAKSLEHYKAIAVQDGKRFRSAAGSGAQFQFSNVNLDTKICLIDDIRPDFSFDMLFSMITGDMEVERKGVDKFVIPASRTPKFILTTNYVIAGSGVSYTRRQHIVEFGAYWNRCNIEKEKPSAAKHLGKMLFDDFNDDDWNDFYNYGFNCVQEYFNDGLVQASISNYERKALAATIEGEEGDGEITDWIDNWIKNTRIQSGFHKDDGIAAEDLYGAFASDMGAKALEWDFKRFDKAVWDFVKGMKGYEYNAHLSARGSSKSNRRWQRGEAGKQRNHIRITADTD